MQYVVDEIFVVPRRPRVAQNAPSVLPKAYLRFEGRRVSICRLAHVFRLSVARPDHARSEPKRRLNAHDSAHASPEGRGRRCLSPVNRLRAFMSFIQYRGHINSSVAVTTIPIILSTTCKVFRHASSAWAIPHFFSSERLAVVPDPKLLFRSNWLSANSSCVLEPLIKHSATTFDFPKKMPDA